MGMNSENATLHGTSHRYLMFDLETIALPNVDTFIDLADIKPDSRLKDEAKIKASIEEKRAARIADAALDPALNRIICLGLDGAAPILLTEDNETLALEAFWALVRTGTVMLVGFNVLHFDLPVLIMRSWLLGVTPAWDTVKPYGMAGVIDLRSMLAFGDKLKPGGLGWWCRRFGIPVDDTTKGCDVAKMWANGSYTAIEAHCLSDLALTAKLAAKLGVK